MIQLNRNNYIFLWHLLLFLMYITIFTQKQIKNVKLFKRNCFLVKIFQTFMRNTCLTTLFMFFFGIFRFNKLINYSAQWLEEELIKRRTCDFSMFELVTQVKRDNVDLMIFQTLTVIRFCLRMTTFSTFFTSQKLDFFCDIN